MQLKPNTFLQGGKYRIDRVLSRGGFGITYEAEQVSLGRKVALKEFFMQDCCERDETTGRVTGNIGAHGESMESFREKFTRAARLLAKFNCPNIVRVIDLFDENGTSYYVIDFLSGGALADKVKMRGRLCEEQAERYIRQVADALACIHAQNTVCTEVKPSKILLNDRDEAVLTDLGMLRFIVIDDGEDVIPAFPAKGFASLEQECSADISKLSPSSDIYALGATLYYLVSGLVPPHPTFLLDDCLPRPKGISDRMWRVIELSMRIRWTERPQSVSSFLSLL